MINHRHRAAAALLGAGLIVVVVGVLTSVWQLSRNSLVENGRWVSSKRLMQGSLMGSGHFLLERQTLYRNRLNLHAWHGFSEVYLNHVFSPGRIRARVRIVDGAHVSVIFNRNESGFDGIRLSRHDEFPSMFFHADRRGHFETKTVYSDVVQDDEWHTIELDFATGALVASIDGKPIDVPRVAPLDRQFMGFRGGRSAAMVDDVHVEDARGAEVISESFANRNGRLGAASRILGLVMVVAGLFAAFGRLTNAGRRAAFAFVTTMLTVLVISTAYYAFDGYFWSRWYTYYEGFTPIGNNVASPLVRLERYRRTVFRKDLSYQERRARIRRMHLDPFILEAITAWDLSWRGDPRPLRAHSPRDGGVLTFRSDAHIAAVPAKDPSGIRLAFTGTSQTFGVGVEVDSHRFVDRIHRDIVASFGGRGRVDTLNFSIPGTRSTVLVEKYEDQWIKAKPDILVINLSFNDSCSEELSASLRRYLRLNEAASIRTLFVTEPSAPATAWQHRSVEAKRDVMRDIAAESGLPLVDLSAHMASDGVRDSGLLWWDSIHMSSLANEIAAEFLIPHVRKLVEEVHRERQARAASD